MAKTYRPTNDKKQLLPMISTIEQQSGEAPTALLADAGYCSDENLTAIADTWIDAYLPVVQVAEDCISSGGSALASLDLYGSAS